MKKLTDVHTTESVAQGAGIEACGTIVVSGRVTSGYGHATFHIRDNARKIRSALGERLVEGSLNIVLKHPLMFRRDSAIQIRFHRGWSPQLYWRGRLNGIDVWLYRWDDIPLHIVEVVSAVYLRKHLNLSDGDEVRIAVRKCDVGRVSSVGRLTWLLFWLGRKRWSFTKYTYWKMAQRWCVNFGATQFETDKSCRDLVVALIRSVAKRNPSVRWLRTRLRRR